MKIWIFPPLAFVWPSKKSLAFFQFSWPSDVQNHSNLSCFEAIIVSVGWIWQHVTTILSGFYGAALAVL